MASSIFVSGHLGALGKVRTMAPDARIGATWTRSEPPAPSLLRELRAEFWNPVFPVVEPEVVGSMHAAGFKVSVWTVDEQADMVRLLDMGVDAIVTNRIAELRRVLGPAASDSAKNVIRSSHDGDQDQRDNGARGSRR